MEGVARKSGEHSAEDKLRRTRRRACSYPLELPTSQDIVFTEVESRSHPSTPRQRGVSKLPDNQSGAGAESLSYQANRQPADKMSAARPSVRRLRRKLYSSSSSTSLKPRSTALDGDIAVRRITCRKGMIHYMSCNPSVNVFQIPRLGLVPGLPRG